MAGRYAHFLHGFGIASSCLDQPEIARQNQAQEGENCVRGSGAPTHVSAERVTCAVCNMRADFESKIARTQKIAVEVNKRPVLHWLVIDRHGSRQIQQLCDTHIGFFFCPVSPTAQ